MVTIVLVAVLTLFVSSSGRITAQTAFLFASMSDGHGETANFTSTVNQIKSLNPNFILFNGDLENDGVVSSEMDPMINVLKNAGIFNNTFLVRGNHDDHVSGSTALWQSYFTTANRPLPAGVTNYVGMDSSSSYLTYSFDYDNSRFIGLDSNQYGDPPTSAQYTFLDQRLTDAESRGLTHAFIFVHPPEYCVESTHCDCQTATGCGPSAQFISMINKHPIVSATFHGHEHILAWVHMSGARASGLTHEYEEFITSSSGNPYSFTPYPARMDYYSYSSSLKAFGAVTVNGSNFTVNLYHTGNTSPVWSKTFTKSGSATTIPTPTSSVTPTPAKTPTPQPGTNSRPTKYYAVDRVRDNADFAKLAAWGINTAVVNLYTNGTVSQWQSVYNAANAAGIKIVIWPNIGSDNACGWESPFNNPVSGSYIESVKPLLDYWKDKAIGIVIAHEPMWHNCNDKWKDMTAVHQQIDAYTGGSLKIWNYIDNLSDIPQISDYNGQPYTDIMDVAATWQHCAGNAESTCDSSTDSYSALNKIKKDRSLINNAGLNGKVELVFLQDTFTAGGSYSVKFTLDQLQNYSCEFLNTSALDGFMYYTWDEGWYTGNLKKWTDLQPGVKMIHDSCVNSGGGTPAPTPTATPQVKPGDANGDNKVDEADYAVWFAHFGSASSGVSNGDFNSDGIIDGIDYAIWLTNYGK